MNIHDRARIHAALGDRHRLAIVDALVFGDRTVGELGAQAEITGNLVAHHLDVLERAGLIERRISEGDHRRRYVVLRRHRLQESTLVPHLDVRHPLFVCTRNSARSVFAAALWVHRTGMHAESAGTDPASRVNPRALRAAAEAGIDLGSVYPKGYDAVDELPDLVVSVCDRAGESGVPFDARHLHWSVPDPVDGDGLAAFRVAFTEIADRIDSLVAATGHG